MNQRRTSILPQPMASDRRAVNRRMSIVGGLLVAGLLGIAARAHQIAVVDHPTYAERGNRQQLRSFKLAASRGDVVDRNGMTLATSDRVHRIVLNPRQIRGLGQSDDLLGLLLQLFPEEDADYLTAELARDKAYRQLRMILDDEQAAIVQSWKIPGVSLEPATQRVYPRGLLGAHIVGRVNGQGEGNLGIELSLDERLRGRDAQSPAYFARGKKLLIDGGPGPDVARGDTVTLTIDSAIQAMVEDELNAIVDRWNPVGASVVVLDPRNGEVLALASRPTFDPNHKIDKVSQTSSLAVQAAYEPGSTMKAITVAAALDEGVIRENETLYCEKGRWQYTPKHVIRDTHPAEWLDITNILAESSNICTTKIADRLGKAKLHRWVRRFHFGERPAIQLPGATKGLLAAHEKWSDIQAANISFGQGMSASPLQVAAAFGALANNGEYIHPAIVKRVTDFRGATVFEHSPEREKVVRASTARTVLRMLESVVHSRHGTGNNAAVPGYRVAGKTSTAQKANGGKGYTDDQYFASFVGALPAADPRVVILVSVDNPEGGHFGNEVAAPSFARLGEQIMLHLGVPREDGAPPPKPLVIREREADKPSVVPFVGPGPGPAEGDEGGTEPALPGRRPRAERVVVAAGERPDFTGLGLAAAHDLAERNRIDLVAVGSGVAVAQEELGEGPKGLPLLRVHFAPTR
ncbi:MAG: penicillin-binding protein 2 [Myxococcales bacterium]|nr:penicillin-binding protein 2 [Myxococcales bacterium]